MIQAEKLAVIGQMSGHVAHEIRNPLASILLNSELLEEEISSENMNVSESMTLITHIKEEISRLSQVTDEYLSYTRLPRPRKQMINPVAEVSSVISMMMPELNKRNITLIFKYEEGPAEAELDRGQFRQVLINLIKNAMDAMPAGGSLDISLIEIRDNLVLLVKDSGSRRT